MLKEFLICFHYFDAKALESLENVPDLRRKQNDIQPGDCVLERKLSRYFANITTPTCNDCLFGWVVLLSHLLVDLYCESVCFEQSGVRVTHVSAFIS